MTDVDALADFDSIAGVPVVDDCCPARRWR